MSKAFLDIGSVENAYVNIGLANFLLDKGARTKMQAFKVNEIPYNAQLLREKYGSPCTLVNRRQKTTKNSQRLWLWKNFRILGSPK